MSETKLGHEMWRQAVKISQHAKFGCEFKKKNISKTKIYIYIYIYI